MSKSYFVGPWMKSPSYTTAIQNCSGPYRFRSRILPKDLTCWAAATVVSNVVIFDHQILFSGEWPPPERNR